MKADYKKLNQLYCQLSLKCAELTSGLTHRNFSVETGWYNGHYKKDEDGQYQMAYYPIPVISVNGVCDIEIDFEEIIVTSKLKREKAIQYAFLSFSKIPFEAYGAENYLEDYYLTGMTIEQMHENISRSSEKEIGFNFIFKPEVTGNELFEFAKLLRREGFYY